jgi:hypothetical protein
VRDLSERVSVAHRGFAAAGGLIAAAFFETTGNIWMMSRNTAR